MHAKIGLTSWRRQVRPDPTQSNKQKTTKKVVLRWSRPVILMIKSFPFMIWFDFAPHNVTNLFSFILFIFFIPPLLTLLLLVLLLLSLHCCYSLLYHFCRHNIPPTTTTTTAVAATATMPIWESMRWKRLHDTTQSRRFFFSVKNWREKKRKNIFLPLHLTNAHDGNKIIEWI